MLFEKKLVLERVCVLSLYVSGLVLDSYSSKKALPEVLICGALLLRNLEVDTNVDVAGLLLY